jgi:PIN domain nuclease of toxin-antitoxin system
VAAQRLLLDTHALLWWWTDSPKLSAKVRKLIANEDNSIFVSAASAWELATKVRLGKLPEAREAVQRFNELVLADGFVHLAVDHIHALQAGSYEQAHRDPFDRILLAQASVAGLTLLSCDAELKSFGVKLVW